MRIILGIIAFTLTFGLSASLVGLLFGFPKHNVRHFTSKHTHNSAHKHNIRRLLRRDVFRNGETRDHKVTRLYAEFGSYDALYQNSEYRKAISDYHRKSSSMKDSHLPEDFKYAWREHMKAWKNQANYLEDLQSKSLDGEIESASKNYSDNSRQINRTWDQVLRIAQRYGVGIDSSYYQ